MTVSLVMWVSPYADEWAVGSCGDAAVRDGGRDHDEDATSWVSRATQRAAPSVMQADHYFGDADHDRRTAEIDTATAE